MYIHPILIMWTLFGPSISCFAIAGNDELEKLTPGQLLVWFIIAGPAYWVALILAAIKSLFK